MVGFASHMPFRDLTGHRRLLELTARGALRGSLPPSLIFAGPEGVGKRHAAIALAQFVNCPAPAGLDACGVCASCSRIARGVHPDVLLIKPGETGSIRIEQVRDAIDRSAYRPFEGKRRVVIVDDADAMVPEAQNAMLKALEEPPAGSTFVLVTARPDVLLPTVRSRCQRLRFGMLAPSEIAAVLEANHEYSAAEAHAAAAAADGSIGRALEGGSEEFATARDAAATLLTGVGSRLDPRSRLDSARALTGGSGDRDEVGRRLRAAASLLRDLGVLLSRADERGLANADLKPLLLRLMKSYDGDRTLRAFSAIDRALEALERNASPKIVADWVALQV
jgi:DNA polymerase-3 subunit delta'